MRRFSFAAGTWPGMAIVLPRAAGESEGHVFGHGDAFDAGQCGQAIAEAVVKVDAPGPGIAIGLELDSTG